MAWLSWVGPHGESVASTARELRFPRSKYYCLLDEQPDHLVPPHLAKLMAVEGGLWQLNPEIWFEFDALPQEVLGDTTALKDFVLAPPVIWARDPGSNIVAPFCLGSNLAYELGDMCRGARAASNVPTKVLQVFASACILLHSNHNQDERNEKLSLAAQEFRKRGFTPVRGLIHPFQISALRRYYRHLIRSGEFQLGDPQSPRRYVAHNQSVAAFFHRQLTGVVSRIVGEPVKPSYVYLASYQDKAVLEKHTDREQCEFSITFCLDYSPEPKNETPWPLHLETHDSDVTVFQAIGDGLVYRGREIPHYRSPIPENHTSTSIFFHYVKADFVGPLS